MSITIFFSRKGFHVSWIVNTAMPRRWCVMFKLCKYSLALRGCPNDDKSPKLASLKVLLTIILFTNWPDSDISCHSNTWNSSLWKKNSDGVRRKDPAAASEHRPSAGIPTLAHLYRLILRVIMIKRTSFMSLASARTISMREMPCQTVV